MLKSTNYTFGGREIGVYIAVYDDEATELNAIDALLHVWEVASSLKDYTALLLEQERAEKS